jgi:hypothetical protein
MNKTILFIIIALLSAILVYAASFDIINQDDFNLGSYQNTSYNGVGVILSGANLSGTYTSKIFDAGTSATQWDNLSYVKNMLSIEFLYSVDNSGGIWQSKNLSVNWIQVSSDYTPGSGNTGAVNIVSNLSGSLFVANGQNLWGADDKGITWRLINGDINGAGDSNDAATMAIYQNTIYIIDNSEDVLKSTDSGVTFTKVNNTDFNGGNGAAKAMTTNSSGAVFVIDAQSDVWQSINSGVSWAIVKDDFNNGNGNGATSDMESHNNTLFALDGQDLWKSIDSGVNWNLINDDFNGGADSGNGQALVIDLNGNIYIADGNEDIYKSTDSGVTFTRTIENLNGGDGLIKGLASIIYYTNLTFQVRNCSSSDCSDASFLGPDNTSNSYYNNGVASFNKPGRYFQYKAYFTSQDSSITPKLYNSSIGYTILDTTPPGMTNYLDFPSNNSAYAPGKSYTFYVSITDSSGIGIAGIQWQGVNYSVTNLSSIYSFTRSNLAAGTYSYYWWANDSYGNFNSSNIRYYTVAKNTTSLGLTATTPITYGTSTNFAGSGCPSQISCSLDKANGVYGAGTVTFNYSTSGNANYTASSTVFSVNINQASGQVSLYLNSLEDNLTIEYPNRANISAYTSYGTVTLYRDGVDISGENGQFVLRNSGYYNITAVSSGNQNYSSSTVTRWLNVTIDEIAPTITIIYPESGKTYGYNISLPLNYSVSDASGVNSCWWNLDNGINQSITCGQNTTFNASDLTSHVLYLYANDSFGNLASATRTFSINTQIQINLTKPDDNLFTNNKQVQFNYTVNTSASIYNCSLYIDGVLNSTNASAVNTSGGINSFLIELGDGNYVWNVYCTDSYSAFALNNYSLNIDTINPQLKISEPIGTKTSRTGIPLTFSVSDTNLQSCWYNLTRWDGANWMVYRNNQVINCSQISTSFDVADDGNYQIYLTANDSAGNTNFTYSLFTVSTSSQPPANNGNTGGGGGGGGGIMSNVTKKAGIDFIGLQDIIVKPGETKKISVGIKNTGSRFDNDCRLIGNGEYSNWISSKEVKGLSAGEIYNFPITLNIPENLKSGVYNLGVIINCREINASASFNAEIIEKKLGIEIGEIKKQINSIMITYYLSEFSGKEQKVNVSIVLLNQNNERVAEIFEERELAANENKSYERILDIPKNLKGNFNLLINANSQSASGFVQEQIILGTSLLGGFAVILQDTKTDNFLSGFLIVLFLTFAIFTIRRMIIHRNLKNFPYHKHAHASYYKVHK